MDSTVVDFALDILKANDPDNEMLQTIEASTFANTVVL
jgi:hypothetical protein